MSISRVNHSDNGHLQTLTLLVWVWFDSSSLQQRCECLWQLALLLSLSTERNESSKFSLDLRNKPKLMYKPCILRAITAVECVQTSFPLTEHRFRLLCGFGCTAAATERWKLHATDPFTWTIHAFTSKVLRNGRANAMHFNKTIELQDECANHADSICASIVSRLCVNMTLKYVGYICAKICILEI